MCFIWSKLRTKRKGRVKKFMLGKKMVFSIKWFLKKKTIENKTDLQKKKKYYDVRIRIKNTNKSKRIFFLSLLTSNFIWKVITCCLTPRKVWRKMWGQCASPPPLQDSQDHTLHTLSPRQYCHPPMSKGTLLMYAMNYQYLIPGIDIFFIWTSLLTIFYLILGMDIWRDIGNDEVDANS